MPGGTNDTRPYEFYHPTPVSITLGQYKQRVLDYCPLNEQLYRTSNQNKVDLDVGDVWKFTFKLKIHLKSRLWKLIWHAGPTIDMDFKKGDPGKVIWWRFRWTIETFEYRKNRMIYNLSNTEPLLVTNPICALQKDLVTGMALNRGVTKDAETYENFRHNCTTAITTTTTM